ncbi:hypothetical protein HY994_01635 [Candidatus Micrarchaeota archaeon]|nr:hypothetical protein [Candidatus Micrarchaeota archaeon]
MQGRYEPFSQRVMELIDAGLFQQNGFEFRPLSHGEWVAPRVTLGNMGRVVGMHTIAAETRARKTGFQLRSGMHYVDVHPNLPRRLLMSEPESRFVWRDARRFLRSDSGKKFVKTNRPAMLLWKAHEGMKACSGQLYLLSRNFSQAFHGFDIDTASNNFLFRGFNGRGEPIVSIIDQNPHWHLLTP